MSQLNNFDNMFATGGGIPVRVWVGLYGDFQCVMGNGNTFTSPY